MARGVSSPTRRAMIKTGTYTGDGTDNRNINIGINLAAKPNVYVIVKADKITQRALHRIEYGQGDLCMDYMDDDTPNEIQMFISTGFQVGSHTGVNDDTYLYRYIVFWREG